MVTHTILSLSLSLSLYHIFLAETRDRTGDLQIFSLTLSQLSYRGLSTLALKQC